MRSRTGDEAIYRLILQGIDDARFLLGSALSAMEMQGEVSEDALNRIVRAMDQYGESRAEFDRQFNDLGSRQRHIVESDLRDLWRKLWFAVSGVSRMANRNPSFYNRLRDLRLKFVIPRGPHEQGTLAIGG